MVIIGAFFGLAIIYLADVLAKAAGKEWIRAIPGWIIVPLAGLSLVVFVYIAVRDERALRKMLSDDGWEKEG